MVYREHKGVSILNKFTNIFVCRTSNNSNIFREDVSQSNKPSVKSYFESGNNGNGVTPPESPRRCSSPKSRSVSHKTGKNSIITSEYQV